MPRKKSKKKKKKSSRGKKSVKNSVVEIPAGVDEALEAIAFQEEPVMTSNSEASATEKHPTFAATITTATATAICSAPGRFCSYCYTVFKGGILTCSKCGTRVYCSKDCQKVDWRQHKLWCGRTASLNLDFAVREAGEGRGLGVFALRRFVKGEKIHVERCVVKVEQDNLGVVKQVIAFTQQLSKAPPSVQRAVMALCPTSEPASDEDKILIDAFPAYFKFKYNTFELEPSGHGLCVTASRFNHACLPNCGRQYLSDQQLMVISAAKDIAAGTELTIRYTEANMARGYEAHRSFMLNSWGFNCDCHVCHESALGAKLVKMTLLDAKLGSLGHARKEEDAYKVGQDLIRLYDEVGALPIHYQRTYYDMFQMSVMQKKTLPQAKACIRKMVEYYELTVGGSRPESTELVQARQWAEHPETHELYLLREK